MDKDSSTLSLCSKAAWTLLILSLLHSVSSVRPFPSTNLPLSIGVLMPSPVDNRRNKYMLCMYFAAGLIVFDIVYLGIHGKSISSPERESDISQVGFVPALPGSVFRNAVFSVTLPILPPLSTPLRVPSSPWRCILLPSCSSSLSSSSSSSLTCCSPMARAPTLPRCSEIHPVR